MRTLEELFRAAGWIDCPPDVRCDTCGLLLCVGSGLCCERDRAQHKWFLHDDVQNRTICPAPIRHLETLFLYMDERISALEDRIGTADTERVKAVLDKLRV